MYHIYILIWSPAELLPKSSVTCGRHSGLRSTLTRVTSLVSLNYVAGKKDWLAVTDSLTLPPFYRATLDYGQRKCPQRAGECWPVDWQHWNYQESWSCRPQTRLMEPDSAGRAGNPFPGSQCPSQDSPIQVLTSPTVLSFWDQTSLGAFRVAMDRLRILTLRSRSREECVPCGHRRAERWARKESHLVQLSY